MNSEQYNRPSRMFLSSARRSSFQNIKILIKAISTNNIVEREKIKGVRNTTDLGERVFPQGGPHSEQEHSDIGQDKADGLCHLQMVQRLEAGEEELDRCVEPQADTWDLRFLSFTLLFEDVAQTSFFSSPVDTSRSICGT